jgi:lipooligosaccharide transport system ATP-binding protein
MKTVIEARGLVKKYGDQVAIAGIDLTINKGEVFGLLGPNGAGKSSLMKMMYGSLSLTSGELYILGLSAKKSARDIKSRVGVLPQEDSLDTDFSAYENLLWFSRYHMMTEEQANGRVDDLLRAMHLDQYRNSTIQSMSGGNRRKLALARALINSPEVLFLDEPTTGLDPDARLWIWDHLKTLRDEKKTSVILTTHYMEEAEKLCDRVAILSNGIIIALGSPKILIQESIGTEVVELDIGKSDLAYYSARLQEHGYNFQIIGKNINVHLSSDQKNQDVLRIVQSRHIHIRSPNLSDVYLKLTGRKLERELQ